MRQQRSMQGFAPIGHASVAQRFHEQPKADDCGRPASREATTDFNNSCAWRLCLEAG
jgi:hypothetical protein